MTIRRFVNAFFSWQAKRRLYRAHPELRHFDAKERELRQRHGKVRDVQAARVVYMTELLRRSR